MTAGIRLIVGLGNPGAEYERTRHNAGFWWVDSLALAWKLDLGFNKSHNAFEVRTHKNGEAVWLQKPQTFMNRSGQSVGALARFYKLKPEQILVIHDELDIQPGEAKLKLGGSAAGHNGLKDIHSALGSLDFWRLRLGIGHPGVKAEVHNWVLGNPRPEHRDAIDAAISRSLKAADTLLAGDITAAMQHIHTTKAPRPKPPRNEAAVAAAALTTALSSTSTAQNS